MANYHPLMYFAAQVMMPRLDVTDNREPCPHCGDLMNEDPEHGWHCNTKGCAGFKPEAWPEGSIGRATTPEGGSV
jgi:hypothetical protein